MSDETISQDDFASETGISKRQVQKLIRLGILPVDSEKHLLHRAALTAWEEYTAKAAPKTIPQAKIPEPEPEETPDRNSGSGANANEVFRRSRAALTSYKAKLARLEFELTQGEVIRKAEVAQVYIGIVSQVNSALDGVAARCAPRCEGKTARDIEEIIDEEIQLAKESLKKNPIQ